MGHLPSGDKRRKAGFRTPSVHKKDATRVSDAHEHSLHYEKMADGTVKCIEDEIPFELPDGWAWERLGNVSTIARGGSPRPIEDY